MGKTSITINPDWLQFTLIGDLKTKTSDSKYIELANGFVLKDLGYGTQHFIYQYEVWHEGVIFGNLRTEPRNDKVLQANWQSFKVDNARLYEVGYLDRCKLFFKTIGSEVRNCSKLDIAADGYGYMRVVQRCLAKMITKKGKAKLRAYFDNNMDVEGFDIGSKKSDKCITGYKKARRIEPDNKQYIRSFWKKSGLIGAETGDIERLELKLSNNAIIKIEGFDWTRLEEPEYLAGIMKKQMENFFEFVKPVYSNISRAITVEFINWSKIKCERLEFASAKQSTEYDRIKKAIKTNFWCFLQTGKRYYLQICHEQADNINCLVWFIEKNPYWKKEFEKKGQKKLFEYLPHWKTAKVNEQLKLVPSKSILSMD